jgi:hypothetical protein
MWNDKSDEYPISVRNPTGTSTGMNFYPLIWVQISTCSIFASRWVIALPDPNLTCCHPYSGRLPSAPSLLSSVRGARHISHSSHSHRVIVGPLPMSVVTCDPQKTGSPHRPRPHGGLAEAPGRWSTTRLPPVPGIAPSPPHFPNAATTRLSPSLRPCSTTEYRICAAAPPRLSIELVISAISLSSCVWSLGTYLRQRGREKHNQCRV